MSRQLLVYGGPIYTLSEHGRVEALLIENGKVLAVGRKHDISRLCSSGAQSLHLDGRSVVPGMHDSHIHLNWWSLSNGQIDLRRAETIAEALEMIRAFAQGVPEGKWITGGRWDKSLWAEFPHCRDLDKVSLGHPVYLSSKDGHSAWANSLAMQLAGITENVQCPPGGAILRDESGALTGVFQDAAMALVAEHVPAPEFEDLVSAVEKGIQQLWALGLTGAHVVDGASGFRVARALWERGRLRFRISASLSDSVMKQAIDAGLAQGFGDEYLFFGPIKMFKDGALGSSTAYMIEPYEHLPGYRGLEVMTRDELVDAVRTAVTGGFATAVHAIGDLACREVLDVFEMFRAQSQHKRLRHRIEHAQLLTESDLPRFRELDVVASVQPSHVVADRYMADREWGKRARWAYPFQSLVQSGAVLAFGSDGPVDEPDPIYGIHCAVNRNAPGEAEALAWYPEERMSVADSLIAYTRGAAYSIGREHMMGDLAPGKLADFVVLSLDPMAIPKDEIMSVKVEATVVGGQIVHGPLW